MAEMSIKGKLLSAKANGRYTRGQLLAGSDVVSFYVDTDRDGDLSSQLLGLAELTDVAILADVYGA